MTEQWKVYLLILLFAVTVIPVSMACAKVDVSPWMLISGHFGSMVIGVILYELGRRQ